VDANIQITPPEATNPVGTNHVLTGHVNVIGSDGVSVSAPAGTTINFSLTNTNGATAAFVGPSSCTTVGATGSCTVTISSPTPGDTSIHATTDVTVETVALHRETGDGHPGDSADAIKHWITGGKSLNYGGSMEGALKFKPGDFVNGGFHFWLSQKNPVPVTVTVTGTIDVPVHCGGANGPLVGTIHVPVSIAPFTIPANSTAKYLTGDQNSILSWMGSVPAPDLCGGQTMYNSEGAVFNVLVNSSAHTGVINFQWHYRIPAAKNKPNTDCLNAADPNRDRADVCGASWSATKEP